MGRPVDHFSPRFALNVSSLAGISFSISGSGTEISFPIICEKFCLTRAAFRGRMSSEKALEAIVLGHTKGNRNYTTEIHKLLTLELLHRALLDPR